MDAANVIDDLTVRAYNGSDLVGEVPTGGGWTGSIAIPWTHLDRGESYKFQIVNSGDTTIDLNGGEVWYDAE